jgi:DNA-directed RNA polymerase subunit RPC12/RpoP
VQRSEDLLLGKLAVREAICTQEQVDECLRMQTIGGSTAPLGDLLLFKGYLTAVQLKGLLAKQHKKIMRCLPCTLSFTVLTLSEGKPVRCPKCRGVLSDAAADGPTRTDAEFDTGRIRIAAAAGEPRADHVCIICGEVFEEVADVSGRVKCPSCRSTFTSQRTS